MVSLLQDTHINLVVYSVCSLQKYLTLRDIICKSTINVKIFLINFVMKELAFVQILFTRTSISYKYCTVHAKSVSLYTKLTFTTFTYIDRVRAQCLGLATGGVTGSGRSTAGNGSRQNTVCEKSSFGSHCAGGNIWSTNTDMWEYL